MTAFNVAVHCQVRAYEEQRSWLHCQVAKFLEAQAASREQWATCPEDTQTL